GDTPEARRFFLDFAGGQLDELATAAAAMAVDERQEKLPIEAILWASAGELGPPVVQYNPFDNSWRAFFDLVPGEATTVELRCFLRLGQDVLTETWSHRWIA